MQQPPVRARTILRKTRISAAVLLVAAITSACEAQSARTATPARVDSIPFALEESRIYVPVRDSVHSLGWFILDTGAQPSGVDAAVAQLWRATPLDSMLSTGAGGGRTRSFTIRGRPLAVGNVPFETRTLYVTPYDTLLGAVSGRVVSGIIGSAFFYQHDVTIDFDRRMLFVRPPGTSTPATGAITLPFTLRSDVPFSVGTLRLPDGRVIDANYLIDLGAKATVLFGEPFLRRTGVDSALTGPSFVAPLGAGVGGRTRYRFTRVPEITIGSDATLRWNDLVVGLSVGGTIASSYFDGLFGLDMLLRYTPTFDYKRSRLILVPRARPPASSEIDLSGLFLLEERTPRAVRTSAIVDSSPASDANMAVGDELLEIDGHATATMTLAQIRDVLRSEPGRRIAVKLRRGSSVLEKVIVLRKMA